MQACKQRTVFSLPGEASVRGTPFAAVTSPNGHSYAMSTVTSSADFHKRDGGMVQKVGSTVYLFGGFDSEEAGWEEDATNEVVSSPANDLDAWTEVLEHDNATPTGGAGARFRPRHDCPNFVWNGRIWIIGGDRHPYNDIWKSGSGDPATWERVLAYAPFGPVLRHMACVFNDEIHVFGGVFSTATGGTNVLNKHWKSADGVSWTRMPDMPFARAGTDAIVHDGHILIIGGHSGTDSVRVYENSSWAWNGSQWAQQSSTAAWDARMWCRPRSYDGKLWMTTGLGAGGQLDGCWYSEDLAKTWTSLGASPWGGSHADGVLATEADGYVIASGSNHDDNVYRIKAT